MRPPVSASLAGSQPDAPATARHGHDDSPFGHSLARVNPVENPLALPDLETEVDTDDELNDAMSYRYAMHRSRHGI